MGLEAGVLGAVGRAVGELSRSGAMKREKTREAELNKIFSKKKLRN